MRRRAYTQLPLRRVLFLQQPWCIRGAIVAIMYFEDGFVMPQIARYLGVSVATVWTYIHQFTDYPVDDDDMFIAREVIQALRSNLLYGSHF